MSAPVGCGVTRREVLQRVSALLGGAALAGGEQLFALSFDAATLESATAQGTSTFKAEEVALLDEIAENILPETTTTGARAAPSTLGGASGARSM